MKRHRPSAAAIAALIVGFNIIAAVSPAGAVITVNQPWVRPATMTQAAEAYMDITSSEGAVLLGVHADAATSAAIVAPGRKIGKIIVAAGLALPPRTTVALAPHAYRIALLGVHWPLKPGGRVMLVLAIEMADGSRQEIPVDAEIRMHSPIDDELRAHGHIHAPH